MHIKLTERLSNDFRQDSDGVLVRSTYLVEDEDISKFYTQPQLRSMVGSLSSSATKLFVYIGYELKSNCPLIWINYKMYMREFSEGSWLMDKKIYKKRISINTYKKALQELQDKNMLKPFNKDDEKYKDVYWINPQFFWNGKRHKVFPDNSIIRRLPK